MLPSTSRAVSLHALSTEKQSEGGSLKMKMNMYKFAVPQCLYLPLCNVLYCNIFIDTRKTYSVDKIFNNTGFQSEMDPPRWLYAWNCICVFDLLELLAPAGYASPCYYSSPLVFCLQLKFKQVDLLRQQEVSKKIAQVPIFGFTLPHLLVINWLK